MKILTEYAIKNNIPHSDGQLEKLASFINLLLEKNKVMNLTAIKDPDEAEVKHLVDSIAAYPLIRELAGANFSLVDVGCGGGVPGIPLKIMFPESRFVLLDSLNKRIKFVNETIEKLGLEKAEGIAARAEDFANVSRETFDVCVSRAVARTNVLLEYCLPLVKVGGFCILYKSSDYKEELNEAATAIRVLGGELFREISFELPAGGGKRSFIAIKKIHLTPAKYPRQAGKPSKNPIV